MTAVTDPGSLPSWPSPEAHEHICFQVLGLPPDKDRISQLETRGIGVTKGSETWAMSAIAEMAGRTRYLGSVNLDT